jgi:hypothetical protein
LEDFGSGQMSWSVFLAIGFRIVMLSLLPDYLSLSKGRFMLRSMVGKSTYIQFETIGLDILASAIVSFMFFASYKISWNDEGLRLLPSLWVGFPREFRLMKFVIFSVFKEDAGAVVHPLVGVIFPVLFSKLNRRFSHLCP